ncbi:hypothetical protein FDECE_4895 [Fusarium decemcellulare]|nr:hypothetical protein FDECE_4895 [Fusarium decemcellulare]
MSASSLSVTVLHTPLWNSKAPEKNGKLSGIVCQRPSGGHELAEAESPGSSKTIYNKPPNRLMSQLASGITDEVHGRQGQSRHVPDRVNSVDDDEEFNESLRMLQYLGLYDHERETLVEQFKTESPSARAKKVKVQPSPQDRIQRQPSESEKKQYESWMWTNLADLSFQAQAFGE